MPGSKALRALAIITICLLSFGFSCGNDDPEDTTIDSTDPPESTPSVEAISDFELVGNIDEAFAGMDPPVDIPDSSFEPDSTDAPSGTDDGTSPTPFLTPSGTSAPSGQSPTRGGILRLEIEDLSEDLAQACGLSADSVVHIYWTTTTNFDPADVLDDVEDSIEGETTGITGTVFRVDGSGGIDSDSEPSETVDIDSSPDASGATSSPSLSPSGTPSTNFGSQDCLLVAEEIFFTSVLPTPRAPGATRTTAPAGTPRRTSTPTPKVTSTPKPTSTTKATLKPSFPAETDEPTDEPTGSPGDD